MLEYPCFPPLCRRGGLNKGTEMNRPTIVCHMMTSVDGRAGFPPVFDGLPQDAEPIPLTLKSAQALPSGAVWLRYLPAK